MLLIILCMLLTPHTYIEKVFYFRTDSMWQFQCPLKAVVGKDL